MLPSEGADLVVATTGVPVGGDGARGLELGEVFREAKAEAVLSETTDSRDAIEASSLAVLSI